MSYSYAKRSFPRRRRSSGGGGAAGWLAAVVLAVAVGGVWWAKKELRAEKTPEDAITTIIPSSEAINNPEDVVPETDAPKEAESTLTLHLEGFTVWGVQKGIYGTLEAAQEAAGERELLFEAEDGYRVIESVWSEKSQAQARGKNISADSYAAQLKKEGLNLKLTGSDEKLKAVEGAVQTWSEILQELLELQRLLQDESISQATAVHCTMAAQERLNAAKEGIPEETEVLLTMREALTATVQAMEEIVAANREEKVDFVEIFRYNVGISHNIYNSYLSELLSSS